MRAAPELKLLPCREAYTRVLGDLPPERQASVWKRALAKAAETGKPVTASLVAGARRSAEAGNDDAAIRPGFKVLGNSHLTRYEWPIQVGEKLQESLSIPRFEVPGKSENPRMSWVKPVFGEATPYSTGASEAVVSGFETTARETPQWRYLVYAPSLPQALQTGSIPENVWLGIEINSQNDVARARAEVQRLRDKHPDATLFLVVQLQPSKIELGPDILGLVNWVVALPPCVPDHSEEPKAEWDAVTNMVQQVREAGRNVYLHCIRLDLTEMPLSYSAPQGRTESTA
jgi:hypothetical protein